MTIPRYIRVAYTPGIERTNLVNTTLGLGHPRDQRGLYEL